MTITIVCGLVIFIFLISYNMFCNSQIRAAKDELTALNEQLEKHDVASFEYAYDNLDMKFGSNAVIGSAWKEYSKSVIKIIDANIPQRLFSTIEASAYLNTNNVLSSLNIVYWQNLSGVFTGLGILGTFLGLTVGLENIDLQSTDINVLKAGIGNLLSGLKNAFWTSLLGISAAIGFNIWHGKTMQELKVEINKFAGAIDEFIVREPAEKWLAKNFS